MKVAEVILPVPVRSNFDYRIPAELEGLLLVGMRVVVPFGKSKLYTGVVKSIREIDQEGSLLRLKRIQEIPDDQPVLYTSQLKLFEWIASYYFCTEGEVLKASLPAGLKLESEIVVLPTNELAWQEVLSEDEIHFLNLLRNRKQIGLDEAGKSLGLVNPVGKLRGMEARGLLSLQIQLKQGFKQKTERFVKLADPYRTEEGLNAAFADLGRSPRQEEVLMLVVEQHLKGKTISKKELDERLDKPESALKALVEKGILDWEEVPVDRLASLQYREMNLQVVLNEEQRMALGCIKQSFSEYPGKPVLLHGVTGSGKTHVYIELIRECLEQGKQVLYLLPEIALTQQIIDKVKSVFGSVVGVYHSRFNDHERVEIWHKLLAKEYRVVIGVRSAMLMPFDELGLVIVDEEHDQSFKQSEPSPRYHARDVAVYAAKNLGCQVVLGSATPSFESYHLAQEGKYLLVEMPNRAQNADLPDIQVVDMREQRKNKMAVGHFSSTLLAALESTLKQNEQVILFQNRRGFSPWISCKNCGHVPKCINCDISLTYHKARKHLRCHYCGHTELTVDKCLECGSFDIGLTGIGTERIEEELQAHFPTARIARMDLDTTQTRLAFLKLIRSFEAHDIDILVGTQMVSKGLDFANVTLVGVMDADLSLNFADFRAHEHAYQLLTQVSGRAGRSEKKGRVIIQTSQPEIKVLKLLQKPFRRFFSVETPSRQELNYPPYTRLIRIEIRHRDQVFLEMESARLRAVLLPAFGDMLLGPEYPHVARLRMEYRQFALLKIPRNISPSKVKALLANCLDQYYTAAPQKTLRILVDVDPV